MLPSEITVEVVDNDLERRAYIPPDYWTDIKCTSNLRAVGDWTMTLPADLKAAQLLATPGYGILITGPEGELFSGPTDKPVDKGSVTDPNGTFTFTGPDYNVILDDALAWPSPEVADITAQTRAYDIRTGPAETVIRSLIDANIGPSAPSSRRGHLASRLTLDSDQQRGTTLRASSRFDQLLAQAASLTKVAGLGFRIIRTGPALQLVFFVPEDKSKQIRLDLANGRLISYEHTASAPLVTRVAVAGQGEGADRTFLERTNPDALAAEAAWGRRIERFKDERNTDVQSELEQAGDDVLADGGFTGETLQLTPTDDETMRYQRDWFLGDYISATVRGREIPQVVTKVGLAINKTGVLIGATVGDLDVTDIANLQTQRRLARLETRI